MSNCPICNTPGAYIGFSTVECRNPDCSHYEPKLEELCPCCGVAGHRPEFEISESVPADNFDPSIPAYSGSSGYGNGPAFSSEPSAYSADPAGYGADGSSTSTPAPIGDASGYLNTPSPDSQP
ncbi:MAG TPA: hypothetical protein VEJ63_15625 [Planctomycetota bacterium]|nr:hypothetical protein [Planctomycetota bacterium]